jgi:glycosyltransferase involved in cell wall biosynthesis
MLHQPSHILETLVDPDIVAQTDCILVVSPCQKEYFEKRLPQALIKLIPLGVDTDYFQPGYTEKKSGIIKCLAGGVWLRDYKALFTTAAMLKKHPEFEFHIVTKGLDIPDGLDNIVLHSGITDKTFLELYQTSHVLFMPMLSATANNVILESISCGLPVLTTDLQATRYYLPGEEANLVKDNDPVQFADTLMHLHNNPQILSEMSRKARERALTFSWKRIIKEYERLYLSLGLSSERGNQF